MVRLVIGLLVGALGVLFISGLGQNYATEFRGSEKFETLDEAYEFQKEIISYSESQDFKVSSEVLVYSTPKVSYRIWTRDKDFWPSIDSKYGSRNFSHAMLVLVYIMALIYFITVFLIIQFVGRDKSGTKNAKQD